MADLNQPESEEDRTDDLTNKQKESLLKVLRKEEQAASNYQDSELMGHRTEALDYYDRQPYGDEQEGSSSIVTSEFADTIESMMPSMMRVFAGSESNVDFTPTGPGQEKAAEEASEYVPHVLMVKNEGYRILYWMIKDALMYRLSGVTVDVEEIEETKDFPINGLPQDAIDVLVQQAEKSGAELELNLTADQPEEEPEGAANMLPPPPTTYSGTITATQKRRIVTADNIAPEDILFTPTARDQDKASYLGFRKKVSASDLVELGMPWDDVQLLRSDRPISPEETERNSNALVPNERDEPDDSERQLWVVVAYVRWAEDDDGKSKMFRCVYAHARGELSSLIEAKEWEGPASITLATPILMSHTIIGRSQFDQTKDLQEIGTVLTRGLLNNLYAVNTPRPIVDDQVNLDSLIDWVPGSPIRLKAGAKAGDAHVSFLQVPSVLQNATNALEYFATLRENRTGVVRNNQGLDADSLNKTVGGMAMQMNAGAARVELIARTLAETAVKRLYRLIYRAIKRAAKGPMQYWNGQSMGTVDPTKWPDDMELTVNVGAGTRDQALQGLSLVKAGMDSLIALQQGQANGPYVTPENVANLAQKTVEAIGYRTPGFFFQPPEKVTAAVQQMAQQPPPPSPEMQIMQLKVQGETAKAQSDQQIAQVNAQAAMAKAQGDQGKAQVDAQAKQMTIQLQAQKQAQDHERALQELAIKQRANEQLHERETQKMALDAHNQQADRAHKEGIEVLGVVAGHHQAEQNNAAKSELADKAASSKEMAAPAKGAAKGPAQGFLEAIHSQSKIHSDSAEKHAAGVAQLGKHIGDGMKALAESHGKLADALMADNELVRGPDGKATGTRRKRPSVH